MYKFSSNYMIRWQPWEASTSPSLNRDPSCTYRLMFFSVYFVQMTKLQSLITLLLQKDEAKVEKEVEEDDEEEEEGKEIRNE